MDAIILAGGIGSRIWPYDTIRNKGLLPVANHSILSHTVSSLEKSGCDNVTIIGSWNMDDIKHEFANDHNVRVIVIEANRGNVDTLLTVFSEKEIIVLYADTLIQPEDIYSLVHSDVNTILLGTVPDDPHDYILALTEENMVKSFIAHPRGYKTGLFFSGGHFDKNLKPYLENCGSYFRNTKVGIGAPNERVLEDALNDYLKDHSIKAIEAKNPVFDINMPWQLLDANAYETKLLCSQITKQKLGKNTSIHPSAIINGNIQVGDNSYIGNNVLVKGNIIVGDNTTIEQSAVISGNVIIGDNCHIANSCKIGEYSVVGDECIIDQTAELLSGILMRKNYLYHHGEFYGILGERCDLGAGCVSGTLRFDDGQSVQKINGRKHFDLTYGNATFIGDFTRCGVGAIFFPGVKVGTNSIIGSGMIVDHDIKNDTLAYVKQEVIEKEWSYKRYGW